MQSEVPSGWTRFGIGMLIGMILGLAVLLASDKTTALLAERIVEARSEGPALIATP